MELVAVETEWSGPSDNELMLAYQGGDVAAFEQLYRRHRVPLFNFCLRMVGSRDLAADAMQEAFTRATEEEYVQRELG